MAGRRMALGALAIHLGCTAVPELDREPADESSTGAFDAPGTFGTSTSSSGFDATGRIVDDVAGDGPLPPPAPARYPAHRIHSPITPHVVDTVLTVAERAPSLHEDVFMKVGASSTVSPNNLSCFIGPGMDLGDHTALQPTLAFFEAGDAAGATPFGRISLAAETGKSAGWAIDGDPSPIAREAEAVQPRLALVHFGTNDMQLGTTPATALPGFYADMVTLVAELTGRGVVTVLFGITRRGDDPEANRWVATYNTVIRGIAQAWQVPFVDLYNAIDPLPGHGLSPDGIHLEAFEDGACLLSSAGLEHGYNMRNLVALQALDRAVAVLVDHVPALDETPMTVPGDGSVEAPFEIDTMPWADSRDTVLGASSELDVYDGCSSNADESGPEMVYRLDVAVATPVRAVVLDEAGVDIDLHLLDASATAAGCLERDDRMIETTLAPGTYHFVLDTWAGAGMPLAGRYLFVLLPCDDDDAACL